jgi:putative FmdB family regulatory protein
VPIYEYRCNNGHVFEVFQKMSDDPVTECEECGAPVERVFHPVAVHFKGSGFYTTDYGSKKKAKAGGESSDGGGSGDSSGSGDSGASKDSGSAKGSDSKGSDGGSKAKASAGGD